MRDVWFSQFARAMLIAVRMVNRLTLLALAISFFGPNHDLTWFLAGTFLITGVGSALAKASYMKYSRVCEYRADAIATELTTPAHRQHLVDALKVVREMSFIALLKKKELDEIDSGTHPTIRNRAKALGVKLFSTDSPV
jgi:Zn-dependent protease with chaperone function